MAVLHNPKERPGIEFLLPEEINKKLSVIEVGPFDEQKLAEETSKFLDTGIESLFRINTYLLVHDPGLKDIESLLTGKPFVDPIIHTAALNKSLALKLGLPFDYVLQSMLNPGTSDDEGDTALRQTLLALGKDFTEGDTGFFSKQYFLKGKISPGKLEEISAFFANPELNARQIISRKEYESGVKIQSPIVILKPDVAVREYDILNMSDLELLSLNKNIRLAATLEEMQHFRDMFKDPDYIAARKSAGLGEKATDADMKIWFGLRSEHCFHKEFNAIITLDDLCNDPVFKRASEKGWLAKNLSGQYVLEHGIFNTFIEEPIKTINSRLEKRGFNWLADYLKDNAGTVYYDENFMFCIKFETHNSPSNKEPVQGAKTGIDGVNRDIFGNMLGTFEAIANFFGYFTGRPDYKGWLPKGVKHPYVILKGVTQGVREGGNEMQIPTMGGTAGFDPRFIAKCLLFAGTVGFSPVRSPDGTSYLGKHPSVRDRLFVSGMPVGRDGIDGATDSSLNASSYISLGHVQADFSFVQAKMKEYLLECARDNLFTSIGDCGAMGISVALELAKDTGGLILDLAKHPRKYAGIQTWEVACSETQDRMVPVAHPKNKEELLKRARLHDVDITEIGELTDSGYARIKWGDKTVALIDLKKLSSKEPRKNMYALWDGPGKQNSPKIKGKYSLEETLCMVMEEPDIASKEWFFRQKDSSVKGATIQGPLLGLKQEVEADVTIQKPLDTQAPYKQGKDFGAIAYALGISPKISDLDPYHSAQISLVDMAGKIIAAGGALPDMTKPKWDAWAVCGNYCQPNSESKDTLTKESGAKNLASLLREAIGVREVEEAFNIPVISGKDSMKCSCVYEVDDSFNLEQVPPDLRKHINLAEKDGKKMIEIHDPDTYLASCAVKIEDYRKCVTSDLKQEGDHIYVIGTTKNHLGASELLSAVGYKEQGSPLEGGMCPSVDFEEFTRNSNAVHAAIDKELVASSAYVHAGGLAVALAKAAIAGEKGAKLDIRKISQDGSCTTEQELLYSRTPGRFVLTVAPEDSSGLAEILKQHNVQYSRIGEVAASGLEQTKLDGTAEHADMQKVKEHYQRPLRFDLDKTA